MQRAPWAKTSISTSRPEGPFICCSSICRVILATWSRFSSLAVTITSAYCDQKRTLQEDANVLYGTDVTFDLEQCLNESADDAKAIIDEATDTLSTKVSDSFNATANYGSRVWSDIKAAARKAVDYTDSNFTNLWISATSWFTE